MQIEFFRSIHLIMFRNDKVDKSAKAKEHGLWMIPETINDRNVRKDVISFMITLVTVEIQRVFNTEKSSVTALLYSGVWWIQSLCQDYCT